MLEVHQGKSTEFMVDEEGVLRLGTRLCVPDVDDMRKELWEEGRVIFSWRHGVSEGVSNERGYEIW